MFFKKQTEQKSEKQRVWVFDVGSSSIKILLVDYYSDHLEFIDGEKLKYPSSSFNSNLEFLSELKDQTKEALAKIAERQDPTQTPKRVIAGVGGIGVEGFTSQINYRRARKDGVITENEFATILKRVEERADQLMRKMIAWETAGEGKASLLSSEVIDFNLEGYPVASPVGSVGEKLSFTVYNAYLSEPAFRNLVVFFKYLKLTLVSAVPTSYAMLRVLTEGKKVSGNIVVLDVGQELTEVGIISGKRILGHLGFDVAGNAFTRSVADEFNIDTEDAEKTKLGYSAGKLGGGEMKDIREIVASDCKVFLSGVELILKDFPGFSGFPDDVYVAGGGSLLPGLVSGLQTMAWGEEKTTDKISARNLLPKDLGGFDDKTGKLNSPADVPVVAAALDSKDLIFSTEDDAGFWDKIKSFK